MPLINFLSELDKIKAYQNYRPVIAEMSKSQLEIALLLLINGCELDYSIDMAMSWPKFG